VNEVQEKTLSLGKERKRLAPGKGKKRKKVAVYLYGTEVMEKERAMYLFRPEMEQSVGKDTICP